MRSTLLSSSLVVATALLAVGCAETKGDVLTSFGGDAGGDGDGDGDGGGGDGDGGADPCAVDGPCPMPNAGQMTVCGRTYDIETTQVVPGGAGNPGETLGVSALNATNIDDNALATVQPDQCGWFVLENISGAFGVLAIVTDDLDEGTLFQRVGSSFGSLPGNRVRINAWVMRDATDGAWTSSAGLPFGTFATRGAVMPIYIRSVVPPAPVLPPFQGQPVSGVTITRSGLPLSSEYYFTDTAQLSRSTVDSGANSTSANGSGLLLDISINSSVSGQKNGCTFPSVDSLAVPLLVQVQELNGQCN